MCLCLTIWGTHEPASVGHGATGVIVTMDTNGDIGSEVRLDVRDSSGDLMRKAAAIGVA